jgi:hypothetical protein
MKNYEEMAQNVLRRIDEYENEKRIRRAKITKAAASVTPVCAAAVIGIGLWKGGVLTPEQDQLISSTGDNAAYDVIVPEEKADELESALTEGTAGRIRFTAKKETIFAMLGKEPILWEDL